MSDIIVCEQLIKSYADVKVLQGVDLAIKKGEIVAVVGASGAGKTTLLKILGTLEKPDAGNVFFKTINLFSKSDNQLSIFRNQNIGFIFQFHQLLPEFTAIENVCIPAFIKGDSKVEAMQKAEKILTDLGLAHRFSHKPSELSGGEQQRVSVARALINNPEVILADEPSGNLDSANAEELHRLFFEIREKYGHTFIIVTHNEKLANLADRKLVMKDGKIVT